MTALPAVAGSFGNPGAWAAAAAVYAAAQGLSAQRLCAAGRRSGRQL